MIIHHQHKAREAYTQETLKDLDTAYDHRGAILDRLREPLNKVPESALADWKRHEQGVRKHLNDDPTSRRALTRHIQGMAQAAEQSSSATTKARTAALSHFVQTYPSKEEANAARPALIKSIMGDETITTQDWKLLTSGLERNPVATIIHNDEPLAPILRAAYHQDTAPKGLKEVAGLYIKAIEAGDATKTLSKTEILARLTKNSDALFLPEKVRLAAWNKEGANTVPGKELALMSVRVIESLGSHPHKGKTYGLGNPALSSQGHALNEPVLNKRT